MHHPQGRAAGSIPGPQKAQRPRSPPPPLLAARCSPPQGKPPAHTCSAAHTRGGRPKGAPAGGVAQHRHRRRAGLQQGDAPLPRPHPRAHAAPPGAQSACAAPRSNTPPPSCLSCPQLPAPRAAPHRPHRDCGLRRRRPRRRHQSGGAQRRRRPHDMAPGCAGPEGAGRLGSRPSIVRPTARLRRCKLAQAARLTWPTACTEGRAVALLPNDGHDGPAAPPMPPQTGRNMSKKLIPGQDMPGGGRREPAPAQLPRRPLATAPGHARRPPAARTSFNVGLWLLSELSRRPPSSLARSGEQPPSQCAQGPDGGASAARLHFFILDFFFFPAVGWLVVTET